MNHEAKVKQIEDRFLTILEPLFFPKDPFSNDITNLFSSLLRVSGYEGSGWDPYLESEGILEDLNKLITIELSQEHFPNPETTRWRMGLFFYSHLVEMEAIYEVITNLLRFQIGYGYSPNPYFMFLTEKQQKSYTKNGIIYPTTKIEIIKKLSKESGINVGEVFEEFYNPKIRNAISHSDYIIVDDSFRCRNGNGIKAFEISLTDLNDVIIKAKIFISLFFGLHKDARKRWGLEKHRGIPFDARLKGLMEVLVDEEGLMCGFKVHWPNYSESYYKRTKDGCKMVNMYCNAGKGALSLFVGLYAAKPGSFSPLVEFDQDPKYTKLDSGVMPTWPDRDR